MLNGCVSGVRFSSKIETFLATNVVEALTGVMSMSIFFATPATNPPGTCASLSTAAKFSEVSVAN